MFRVLLAEDDSAMRFIYSRMKIWTECGFQIAEEVSNGKDALKILENQTFDLIFTDIRMPFINGIELLREIKKREINTNVVFASSYNEFEYARQGLILGAFDYILKPVDEKKLGEVLHRAAQYLKENEVHEIIEPAVLEIFKELGVNLEEGKFVHQAAVYFSEHYGKTFSMDEMAEEFEFCKDYFGKLFKQQFGVPFNYFSSALKVEYAKDLLRTGNYKLYEISDMLGYSSTDYFSKVFKEFTGETPSKFKADLNKK